MWAEQPQDQEPARGWMGLPSVYPLHLGRHTPASCMYSSFCSLSKSSFVHTCRCLHKQGSTPEMPTGARPRGQRGEGHTAPATAENGLELIPSAHNDELSMRMKRVTTWVWGWLWGRGGKRKWTAGGWLIKQGPCLGVQTRYQCNSNSRHRASLELRTIWQRG